MLRNLYNFLVELHISIKLMSDSDFDDLLKECGYQQTLYVLYFRYC